jgi:hypothetical protein
MIRLLRARKRNKSRSRTTTTRRRSRCRPRPRPLPLRLPTSRLTRLSLACGGACDPAFVVEPASATTVNAATLCLLRPKVRWLPHKSSAETLRTFRIFGQTAFTNRPPTHRSKLETVFPTVLGLAFEPKSRNRQKNPSKRQPPSASFVLALASPPKHFTPAHEVTACRNLLKVKLQPTSNGKTRGSSEGNTFERLQPCKTQQLPRKLSESHSRSLGEPNFRRTSTTRQTQP